MRTALCKFTTCNIISSSTGPPRYTIMKLYIVWISAEVQARIKPPPIPLIKKETDDVSECDIIKIKMCRNPTDANSEMYKLKIVIFGEAPLILLIKKKIDDASKCDIIKIKMCLKPTDANSEMYKLKIVMFENVQLE